LLIALLTIEVDILGAVLGNFDPPNAPNALVLALEPQLDTAPSALSDANPKLGVAPDPKTEVVPDPKTEVVPDPKTEVDPDPNAIVGTDSFVLIGVDSLCSLPSRPDAAAGDPRPILDVDPNTGTDSETNTEVCTGAFSVEDSGSLISASSSVFTPNPNPIELSNDPARPPKPDDDPKMGADPDPNMGADTKGAFFVASIPLSSTFAPNAEPFNVLDDSARAPKPTLDVAVDPNVATGTPDPNTGADDRDDF
jgi:hypothetical protein